MKSFFSITPALSLSERETDPARRAGRRPLRPALPRPPCSPREEVQRAPKSLGTFVRVGLLILAALLLLPAHSHAQVLWRVSIKVFTDSNGNRPSGRTDAQIQDDYVTYNQLLGAYARGCQFQVTEIVSLPSSLSSWFNRPARDDDNRAELHSAAILISPDTYAYRGDTINLYINNSSGGICCGGGNGLIFVGNADNGVTMFHEIGHMLGLNHTQGAGCNRCCPDPLGCCDTPRSDGIADTILDLPCWDRSEIAQNNFPATYPNLTAAQEDQVDDVWFNLMSYHDNRDRLTPGQMDEVAEASNGSRDNVTANHFIFVDSSSGSDAPFIFGNLPRLGRSRDTALRTVGTAISRSSFNDTLLFRAGTYVNGSSGDLVIADRRTFCARNGTVVIRAQ